MPPVSSLVFVVILAVWAVYLVQHWVRRRDHLATARSVDRFSEAMRVLERRRSLPVPEADAHPRSYAASPLRPARPGRPEVVVKSSRAAAHGATAVPPSRDQRRGRLAARLRAATLLLGWFAMVALVGLAMTAVLPRWSALVGVAACAVAVGAVRWSVARERSTRQAGRRPAGGEDRPRATPAPRRRTTRSTRPATAPAPRRTHGTAPAAGRRPASAPAPAVPAAASRQEPGHAFSAQSVAVTLRTAPRDPAVARRGQETQPYDVHAVEEAITSSTTSGSPTSGSTTPAGSAHADPAPARSDAGQAVSQDDHSAEGTWQPVPVPPPTYTLKARAYRPPTTGSVSLPADGTEMALDEEFEDLPRVDRVG